MRFKIKLVHSNKYTTKIWKIEKKFTNGQTSPTWLLL